MSSFFVAIFQDLSGAQAGIRALKSLAAEGVLDLNGAAAVQKARDGKLTMNVMADDGPAVTATGTLMGGLAGLAIGALAAAVFAAGGAVFGAAAGLTNREAGLAYAKHVSDDLAPGLTAMVAEVTTQHVAVLVTRLETLGGTLIRQETVPAG